MRRSAWRRWVSTFRSAPCDPGAALLPWNIGGEVTVLVSGGCVEGAVDELATEVTESGQPVLQRYGFSDDDAFAVGLTCGGILDVFVEPVNRQTFPELGEIFEAYPARRTGGGGDRDLRGRAYSGPAG